MAAPAVAEAWRQDHPGRAWGIHAVLSPCPELRNDSSFESRVGLFTFLEVFLLMSKKER